LSLRWLSTIEGLLTFAVVFGVFVLAIIAAFIVTA
jgi:hypothetical protein